MAPINAIASDLLKKGNSVDVVPAAVTKDELLFMDSLENPVLIFIHVLMMEVLALKDLQQIVL